ncbi:hypothetical protein BDV38DRAFT_265938 [Aspergillus pseudotamarii]|uniref:AttH domain-containing protein n=1 Tax=Aspergillus pseudotamarii TaxID=132259 RepID=A0A5N6SB50_ASPPS|nr:uncharacterized protein BDV38DRAFT_265938 [Aspergillus pseudotamarii]KAE8130891.1 hypothetical protein BDV38DRAFT_265938 [Aspergillus pseudotamarii]
MTIMSKLSLLVWALAVVAQATSSRCNHKQSSHHTAAYDFHPSQAGIQTARLIDPLPLPYDFNTSNSEMVDSSNSWWISSYLTGSDNHQYMVLSHVLASDKLKFYRGGIYDITEPAYTQFSKMTTQNLTANSQDGKFDIRTGDFFFGSALANSTITKLRTVSNRTDLHFDLTFELTAPILFNTGLGGLFQFGPDQTGEWSMPAGKTSGWLVFNGKKVAVNEKRSQTWYDRQWNVGPGPASLSWTWFQLHIKEESSDENELVSVWMYDSDVKGHRQWATTQSKDGISVVQPVRTVEPFGESWTSPHSNVTYHQAWTMVLQDETTLTITTTYNDQKLWAAGGFATYEGFITVNGTNANGNCVTGFGLVEIQGVF